MAEIIFQIKATESFIKNIESTKLFYKNFFTKFKTKNSKPDVCMHFFKIEHHDFITSDDLSDIQFLLKKTRFYPIKGINSPFLKIPVIKNQLLKNLKHPDSLFIEFNQSSVVIFDFFQRKLIAFYLSELESDLLQGKIEGVIFAPFLSLFSAAMLHSSAILRNGKVVVFLAPDGGGKTTAALNCPEDCILCDDQVIIRKQNDIFYAFSSPWGVHVNPNKNGQLKCFIILQKASKFELILQKKINIMEYLWNEHLYYYLVLPKELRLKTFDFLYEVCNSIPVYLMRFPKDYIDWNAIDRIMK